MIPKILHIDDAATILELVRHNFSKRGIQIDTCSDPAEGLELVKNENYRIVILDVEMPGTNGMDLLEQIKAYDGAIQVIMLTGLVKLSTVLSAQRRGAQACIFKPIRDFTKLNKAVDDSIAKIHEWMECVQELQERRNELEKFTAKVEPSNA